HREIYRRHRNGIPQYSGEFEKEEPRSGGPLTAIPTGQGAGLLQLPSGPARPRRPGRQRRQKMKWVTWQNVGVDRMGCTWLIRKFIDKKPEFLFIAEGSTSLPKGAEPFDIPGARLSHHGGHCSFCSFLREYKLNDPVLKRIGRIVDEADTVQEASV